VGQETSGTQISIFPLPPPPKWNYHNMLGVSSYASSRTQVLSIVSKIWTLITNAEENSNQFESANGTCPRFHLIHCCSTSDVQVVWHCCKFASFLSREVVQ